MLTDHLQNLRKTFSQHHAYHARLEGIVNDQLVGGERALTQQYAGRVPYELLQNALDRCDRAVLVAFRGEHLVVANDGRPVSFDPGFDHRRQVGPGNPLSDFHALCSIHTSNKTPDEDYGNKGVGFKSVFSVADRAVVWTRGGDGAGFWWGLELHEPLDVARWQERTRDTHARRGMETLLERGIAPPVSLEARRPSFHFPVPLLSDDGPALPWGAPPLGDWMTLVVVPVAPDARESVRQTLNELRQSHLDFVHLRKPAVSVHIVTDDVGVATAFELASGRAALASVACDDRALRDMAERAGLALKGPVRIAVRWPLSGDGLPEVTGRVYCYLPSQVRTEFGFDLHADFQLGIDRKNMDLDPTLPVGAYNKALVERGVELHLALVFDHLGLMDPVGICLSILRPGAIERRGVAPRPDIWRFMDPGRGDGRDETGHRRPSFVWPLRDRLFVGSSWTAEQTWQRWATLAAGYFDGTPRPLRAYREFWTATQNWVRMAKREYARVADACLAALRTKNAHVVPVTFRDGGDTGDADERVEGLAPRRPAGDDSGPRIYQICGESRKQLMDVRVPDPIRKADRHVTGWRFPDDFLADNQRLRGTTEFNVPNLLQELRQLPNSPAAGGAWDLSPLDPDPERAAALQGSLLDFAVSLFLLPIQRGTVQRSLQDDSVRWTPGWRATMDAGQVDLRRAGRAVSTLFVPLVGGGWAPARQCHRRFLCPDWLGALTAAHPGLDVEAFLRFLGVCSWEGGLLLVEGAEDGLVPIQSVPPALWRDRGRIPALAIPLRARGALGTSAAPCQPGDDDGPAAGEVLGAVRAAWAAGWLREIHGHEALFGTVEEDADSAREPARRSGVFAGRLGLNARAWFPVADAAARHPAATVSSRSAIEPQILTIEGTGYDPRVQVLWRIRSGEADRQLLLAIGALDLDGPEGRLARPHPALALLGQLRESYPDLLVLEDEPRTRMGFVQLVQQIAAAITKDNTKAILPLDLEMPFYEPAPAERVLPLTGRHLRWGLPEAAWVASDKNDQESVRRFFPELPLFTFALGRIVLSDTPFLTRLIRLVDQVEAPGAFQDRTCAELRRKLDELLPGLLAIADVSRRFASNVDAAEVRARWHRTRFFRAPDVWRTWTIASMPDKRPRDERRNAFGDVMDEPELDGHPRKTIGARVYFDTEKEGAHPPLHFFAAALSRALLDGSIEPDWKSALTEYEAGESRFNEHLERLGADSLVDCYRRQIAPLDEERLARLQERVSRTLSACGVRLRDEARRRSGAAFLRPADLTPLRDGITEDGLNDALDALTSVAEERAFVPRAEFRHDNLGLWHEWVRQDDREVRLLRWKFDRTEADVERPQDATLKGGPWGADLQRFVHERAARLDFQCEAVARDWVGLGPADGPLDALLPPLVVYQPLTCYEDDPGIRPVSIAPFRTVSRELEPETADERQQADVVRASKGAAAEERALDWLIRTTREVLAAKGEAAWKALASALPMDGKLRREWEAARGSGDEAVLKHLRVSARWGSAGFDILGLELQGGEPAPVRYEVKALPVSSGRVRVFVSRNELSVAKKVRDHAAGGRYGAGRWILLGVTPEGRAINLTKALDPLFDDQQGPLVALASHGVRPDALEITFALGAASHLAEADSAQAVDVRATGSESQATDAGFGLMADGR